MAKCTDSDSAALNESGRLLRFAAEHVKDLDPDLPLAIAEAQAAAASDTWDPKIAQRFWGAFAKLCDLIQPVSMDCLAAAEQNIEPSRWLKFFGVGRKSIAQRSSARYLWVLLALLALILPLQLYVWTCTNLSKKVDELVAVKNVKYAALAQDYLRADAQRLAAIKQSPTGQSYHDPEFAKAAEALHDELDRIEAEAKILESISTLTFNKKISAKFMRPGPKALPEFAYEKVSDRVNAMQVEVLKIQEKSNLITGVFGAYILPILFGTIGAIAYIVRTISDQIRNSTFASNSPTRHNMRAALGAMAGLVVGLFGDLSTKLSLSPLAIAFLAGYGVEALFSMFDSIIEKFKQAKA